MQPTALLDSECPTLPSLQPALVVPQGIIHWLALDQQESALSPQRPFELFGLGRRMAMPPEPRLPALSLLIIIH